MRARDRGTVRLLPISDRLDFLWRVSRLSFQDFHGDVGKDLSQCCGGFVQLRGVR